MNIPIARRALPLAALLVAALAACGGVASTAAPTASARPTPTPVAEDPTPTPIIIVVGSPTDAAALVLATNPLFAGAAPRMEDAIGQTKWWVATPLSEGHFRIDVTIGWGDCMAGCIDRHVWSYEVWPDGSLELVSETGPEVPADVR